MFLFSRLSRAVFPNESNPGALQTAMFLPTLNNHLTKEQGEKWLLKAENYQIMGTYAQTEMGHGWYYVQKPSFPLSFLMLYLLV